MFQSFHRVTLYFQTSFQQDMVNIMLFIPYINEMKSLTLGPIDVFVLIKKFEV